MNPSAEPTNLPCGVLVVAGCNHLGCQSIDACMVALTRLDPVGFGHWTRAELTELAQYIHQQATTGKHHYLADRAGTDDAFMDWHESVCNEPNCLH